MNEVKMPEAEFLRLRHELRRVAAMMSREQALDLADHLHSVVRTRRIEAGRKTYTETGERAAASR